MDTAPSMTSLPPNTRITAVATADSSSTDGK